MIQTRGHSNIQRGIQYVCSDGVCTVCTICPEITVINSHLSVLPFRCGHCTGPSVSTVRDVSVIVTALGGGVQH